MSNAEIKKRTEAIELSIKEAGDEGDLLKIIDKIILEKKPLDYNKTPCNVISVVFLLLTCFLSYFFFNAPKLPDFWVFLTPIATFTIASISFAYTLFLNGNVDRLSSLIFEKDVIFDNDFTIEKISNGEALAKEWKDDESFFDFDRGNNTKEIEFVASSRFNDKHGDFDFKYYRFHYVVKSQVTETISDGKGGTKTRTRTVYKNYYRYGLMFDTDSKINILISANTPSSRYKEKYQPASLNFREKYAVYSNKEIDAAKFLNPQLIIAFEELYKELGPINYEINGQGKACLSLSTSLLHIERKHSLDDPSAFRAEIASKNKLDDLNTLLKFAAKIKKS